MNVTQSWIAYADENLAVARLALERGYFNACLQNIQQAVEKYLKAALTAKNVPFQKTHPIARLNQQLRAVGVDTELSEEECELLDAIYIPSKYPAGSVLPDFNPDQEISERCLEIAERAGKSIQPLFL